MYSRDLKKYLEGTFLKIFNMLESIQKETNIIAKTNRVDQNPLQRCLPIVKSTHFDCLPFESIEEILEFDLKVAIDDIFKSDFMIFVSQCGGHTKKENIIRVLKKVFGNKIAQECSWMGFRQNFRMRLT
ncbi:uncharacterized protein isoform X2 [Leptinotarsa decemlineata]|uniref:uncharacterized protein isoform X2 n=1 Tax=Leptinotarsa decemlineata TaxID=7539 RepID=UPI000C251EB4|nr:uncharacterized protein LOC111502569 isoform X2 [Leptinotarsa decemlineata]